MIKDIIDWFSVTENKNLDSMMRNIDSTWIDELKRVVITTTNPSVTVKTKNEGIRRTFKTDIFRVEGEAHTTDKETVAKIYFAKAKELKDKVNTYIEAKIPEGINLELVEIGVLRPMFVSKLERTDGVHRFMMITEIAVIIKTPSTEEPIQTFTSVCKVDDTLELGKASGEKVKVSMEGVPSSKEFKKLQKDNAKLARRVSDLEIDVNHLKLKNAMR